MKHEYLIKNNNFTLLLASANAFYEAYALCWNQNYKTQPKLFLTLSIPAVVNLTLACELYFKCIISQSGIKYPNG